MIVLDTHVISEVFRPEPEARVVAWLEGLTGEVAIAAVTLAELLAGVRRLPDGQRRTALAGMLHDALEPYRATRAILPFDVAAAEQYADVLAARERAGRPIHTADAQIAAICLAHGATCATRNVRDFDGTGVDLVNPWTA
ncbi:MULTISPECIES: type II toxin-antitoxin system VapC family toxin [unclassified Cellulomonas]|uniref:type II toxin-antitoxin system VapC family toxin n=1 Tax=unclassified Cellulomonas TaxID=2620175 RepID=UPI0019850FC6|nr:type II toxin-antitoxin system VapC family toxin [Cellulomonas sp. ES6]MBD3779454.1 type II toxin-antitoxin system VapC family toxin [Micrococcales bacterium]WHP18670.1 type II toxin-antitoxin system VapC family toxin [Cellulomonas sp. ES6]